MKRVAIYLRVSTADQTTENQRIQLEEYARQRGWEVVQVYDDSGYSAGAGKRRPAFNGLAEDMKRDAFDVILGWKLDRMFRSTAEAMKFLPEMERYGVDLCLMTQPIDTTQPAGKLFYTMLAAFAEFERETIVERVKIGMERARRQGKQIGRQPSVPPGVRAAVADGRRQGKTFRQLRDEFKLGMGTVQEIVKGMDAVTTVMEAQGA